jgi:D-glycero-D-manno-heptose 1,7-bisphosphate phosphatase
MNKAVFFDRDGVINKNIYNPVTGEYESPHFEKDFELCGNSLKSIKKLYEKGFSLFIISNQPSYAKGKTSLENIKAIENRLKEEVEREGIKFTQYFYCYHHPDGIVKEYSGVCECRKPKPYFLLKAQKDYDLDLANSWMIGDRDTDVFCGQNAGVKTILIEEENSKKYQGKSHPDFLIKNLDEAINIILGNRE